MIFMLFKVSGLAYLPEHILNDWALEPSRVWQTGEPSTDGTPHEDTGFNITLPNQEDWASAQAGLEDFLEDKGELFQELIGHGADMELLVGVSVRPGETNLPQLKFPRHVLAGLLSNEIDLDVIAFAELEDNG